MTNLDSNYSLRLLMGLLLSALAFGCAEGVLVDVGKKRTATDRSWQPLAMTKADMNNAGATLGIKAIEIQPGETPEQAVLRVFGVLPSYDVRKLLDAQEADDTNFFESSNQPASQGVCNDSCAFANDGVCDEPTYCSTGTDCSDCAGAQNNASATEAPSQAPTCPYTNDGFCDEPTYCPVGTDTADCSQENTAATTETSPPLADSCGFANDGFCDEPAYCEPGTDTTDCSRSANHASPNNSNSTNECVFANDGFCDEPTYCAPGTDTADCSQSTTSAAQPNTNDSDADSNTCPYTDDGVCDEPTYCPVGTDVNDCSAAATSASNGTSANGSNGNTACPYTNDGVCDEPTYCPFGTDTNDCNAAQPSSSTSSGSSGSGGSNSCVYANDGICDEPTYCTFGTDTNDCSSGAPSSSSTPSASTPSAGSSGDNSCTWANDGVCDEGGVCRTGTDSADCSGFNTKFAGAMGGESLEMVIIGYTATGLIMAWRLGNDLVSGTGQLIGSFVDGLRAVDSSGRPISVQLRTDAATIEAARDGRLNGASASPASGNVGVATVNYINERAAESARADGLTCEPSVLEAMNAAKNDICKHQGGKRRCVQKMPNEDQASYCAETQRRLDRNRRCVDARNEVNRVCFGGLGHPDANGVRGQDDSAVEQAENAMNRCLQNLQRFCQ